MPQGSIHWQGTERRPCGPGAQWNVQVVRGKVTTRCLWHACRALGIGLLLMLLGACMATIDQLSVAQEIRGNMTIRVKNESRGFHLNNLSYAGPIVMGVGGFIVVAACVMTFEARDSAAKVVPARYRFNQNSSSSIKYSRNQRPRRSTSCQTTRWDHHMGLFREKRSPSPSVHDIARKQLTAEFLRFSKNLHDKDKPSHPLKKSPSAPSLVMKKSPSKRKASKFSGCALLNPELLQRHALSVDNPHYSPPRVSRESLEHNKMNGSQVSMAMDLYIPNKGPVTLKVKDRSDTARRHQLLRQTKIEDLDEEEARRILARRKQHSAYPLGACTKLPVDLVMARKRASIDVRLTDEDGTTGLLTRGNTSPRDFRKSPSSNFRNMSFDRISASERRPDRSGRKSSLDFRKSPDFRRFDIRRFIDELDQRSELSTTESIHQRQKLYHSRSDDNRRTSFDRNRRDSQVSRHSLNVPVVVEGCSPEYELKYHDTSSVEKDKIRSTFSDDSRSTDTKENQVSVTVSIEEYPVDVDMPFTLVEEPELENNATNNDNDNNNKPSSIINENDDSIKFIDRSCEDDNEIVLDVEE
ncbi:GSCOCG00005385001-RA-CDS [Cotesia congregata]|nr:GSCOCG00005385001-RA-CDS [Cotesia congregata]